MSPASPQSAPEVVITGLGIVSPIGIGRDAFRASLLSGHSGVRLINSFDTSGLPVRFGAEVVDFDPKAYVRPRKSLKVMSREIQLGFAAADLALAEAGIAPGQVEPDRFGVVFGAEMIYCDLSELEAIYRQCVVARPGGGKEFDFTRWGDALKGEMYPLWLLRNLPNMVACHVAIVHDARGPNNTIGHSDVSGLLAMIEAVRVIERGAADVMIAGGVGARVNPTAMSYRGDGDLSHRNENPAAASRPFDAGRDGLVNGEGAAAFVLESREYAARRGAAVFGRVISYASGHERPIPGKNFSGSSVRNVLTQALKRAELSASEIGHVNANGLSTIADDRYEAQAIRDVLGDVPVTAPKSLFGHLGAGGANVELAASMVGLSDGTVSATLNYERPDPECPVNVVREEPLRSASKTVVKLSTSRLGYAAALVVTAD
jgi:3-oxoacyl-[acyl-carrier-protein] synthase II